MGNGALISDLSISKRSCNVLNKAGIFTIEHLCEKTFLDVFQIRMMGRKALKELVGAMEQAGLSFRK